MAGRQARSVGDRRRLAELGYKAYPFDPRPRRGRGGAGRARFLLRCLGVAAFAAMNIMLLSVSVWSGNVTDITPEQRDFFHWLSALIALPAAAYAGQPFFRSAMRALIGAPPQHGRADHARRRAGARACRWSRRCGHAEHAYFDFGGDAARLPAGRPLSRPEHAPAHPRGRRQSGGAEGRDRGQVRQRRGDPRGAGRRRSARATRAGAAGRAHRGRRRGDRGPFRDRPEPRHRRDRAGRRRKGRRMSMPAP